MGSSLSRSDHQAINMSPLVLLAVSLASAAANPAGLMYQPFNYGFNGYSGLPYGLAGHNSRIPYTVPAIAAPTVTETGIDTIISDFPSEFPNIPGLDENQKELIHMVTSLKPEVTAQLARIAANVGPWAALNGAGTPADLARLPPVINAQMASMLAEIWPEVDNIAATSNKLIEEVQPAMQYVPAGMKKQILELTDATNKIATLMQKNNPKLKALANQSLA